MPMLTAERRLILAMMIALMAIGGAWFSELVLHFVPCLLCLWERWPYYIALPLALGGLVLLRGEAARYRPHLAAALGVIFVISTGLGLYHAGVEWKLFTAPDCGGRLGGPVSLDDFRKALGTARVVLCDEAPMRVLGLSFAGWNAVASAVIAALCFSTVRR